MTIARLPTILNGDFISIREALEACVTALYEGRETSFTLSFYDAQTASLTSYVQAEMLGGGRTISIEIQRKQEAEELVLRAQDSKAKVTGWTIPGDSDYNPNYSQGRSVNSTSAREIANEFVQGLKYISDVEPSSWISIDSTQLSKELQDSGLFWKMLGNPLVFCQRGFNIKNTIEGSSAA